MAWGDFGTLVTEVDVDLAIIKTLRKWLPTYLTAFERERGLAVRTFARPRPESYANAVTLDELTDHRLPVILVETVQTAEVDPTQDGYSVIWDVSITAVVRGRTPPETRSVAAAFGSSVRRVLAQQGQLDGSASGTWWMGGGVREVEDSDDPGRFLAAGVNDFRVAMDEVLSDSTGPMQPDPIYPDPDPDGDPDEVYNPVASVDAVTISVDHKES